MDMDTLFADAIAGDSDAIAKLARMADHPSKDDDRTILHIACISGNTERVKFIVTTLGYNDIVKMICNTCTAPSLDGPEGTTALHAVISQPHEARKNHNDIFMVLIESAQQSSLLEENPWEHFEVLFKKTDHKNRTLFSLAMLENHADVVKLILLADPAYNAYGGYATLYHEFDSLISTSAKKRHKDTVKVLCETYEAANGWHKGQKALIVAIEWLDKECVHGLVQDDPSLATYIYQNGWTALHYAACYKFDSVIHAIVKAQGIANDEYVCPGKETPLIVAANKGHVSTVILLMQLLSTLSCVARNHEGQNILHLAAARRNKDMIQSILEYCPESCTDQFLNAQDDNGNTPLHLLISEGCFIPKLMKHKEVNMRAENKQYWTPSDMLYFQDEVVADQVKIKKLLDDTQSNQHWKFWRRSIKGISNTLESTAVPLETRSLKDTEFKIRMKYLMKEELGRMKEELERYRKRTNTQIIVYCRIYHAWWIPSKWRTR